PAWPARYNQIASTHTQILPYLEQGNVYQLFNFNFAVTEPENYQATIQNLAVFQCPSEPSTGYVVWPSGSGTQAGKTNYAQNLGLSTTYFDTTNTAVFYRSSAVRFGAITD